jgi:hypothetical protein
MRRSGEVNQASVGHIANDVSKVIASGECAAGFSTVGQTGKAKTGGIAVDAGRREKCRLLSIDGD